MKIDSGLSGYNYPQRAVDIDRKQDETQQRDTPASTRSSGSLTGSSTLFASSLVSALWALDAGDASASTFATSGATAPVQQAWVQDIYQEFS